LLGTALWRPLSAQIDVDTPAGRIHVSNARLPLGFGYYGGPLAQDADGRWVLVDYPLVVYVDSAGPAARAGLRVHDVLLAVNGNDARAGDAAFRLADGQTRWVLRVQRDGRELEVVLERGATGDPAGHRMPAAAAPHP
jgi:S1-C subfamily serine protease